MLGRFIQARTQFSGPRFFDIGHLLDGFLGDPFLIRLAGVHFTSGFGFWLCDELLLRLAILDEVEECHKASVQSILTPSRVTIR
jgi:hypothetical protein